ncbi:hypothetical protein A6A04_11345 [Paramagnetospirillum marisnigri]|uniref:Uncharacterized protein n=1 Tax=Paramagnetospirillum marisnigri TaxID=1285242 RepID=A0A178MZ01_9PROT|nr:hypothetical protein [Paramagnetospirillum marisnigri]OAN55247.1 hypothetical protein A6A04_11345 [Paramagnetospirillum marisnigri]
MINFARFLVLAAAVLSLVLPGPASAQLAVDAAEVASATFVKGCVGHLGAYDLLREKLQPGKDYYLPQLSPSDARPFLNGKPGEAYARFDAGVTLVLLGDGQCIVFVQKANPERLYKQLDKDIRLAVARAFAVKSGGKEIKGPLLARFFDLDAIGEYREKLAQAYGPDLPGLRVILTTSDTANPNLQGIITIGTRSP